MISGRRAGVTGQSSSAIIKIAIAGIAIGMAVMILSIAIVTGFQNEIREKVIGFGSHLQISLYNPQNTLGVKPMERDQPFVEDILAEPEVKGTQVYAYKSGIISAKGEILGVMSKGVDQDFDWEFFEDNLLEGSVFQVNDSTPSDSVLISSQIQNKLELEVGDKFSVSYIQDELERKRRFIIGGVYDTGMEQFDGSIFLCDIKHVQKLNGWEANQVAGIEVLLHSFEDLDRLDYLTAQHVTYEFNTLKITDQFMDIFGWLELQDINVIIILILMVLVSGINMISALLVLILERTNMIGILKAMGTKNGTISKVFLYNALYLIIIGVAIGNAVGLGLDWLQQKFAIVTLDKSNYYVDSVPVLFESSPILAINLGSIAVCLVMLLIPAMLVSRIDPVKTIRFN